MKKYGMDAILNLIVQDIQKLVLQSPFKVKVYGLCNEMSLWGKIRGLGGEIPGLLPPALLLL